MYDVLYKDGRQTDNGTVSNKPKPTVNAKDATITTLNTIIQLESNVCLSNLLYNM